MVCDGPDPPENNPNELTPPSRHDLMMNGSLTEDSDDEQNEYFGYEPLPQGPDGIVFDQESDEEVQIEDEHHHTPTGHVPPIESMENILTREVWNTHPTDSIQMDNERAQQVQTISSPGVGRGLLRKPQDLTYMILTAASPLPDSRLTSTRLQSEGKSDSSEVMSAMANFALPQASIPDWAQSISEEQWKQTLNDTIEKLKSNR